MAVCGLEAVRALAEARPEAVRRLYFVEARAKEFGPLCSRLAAAKKPYNVVDAEQLERLSGTTHHQGVVAMIADEAPARVDDATLASWAAGGARIVVLDRVGDDHNLGSIARSAAFFGWTAMVVGLDDGSARLTTSAYRVARGALERLPVFADESAAAFVRRCGSAIPTVGADHRAPLGLAEVAGSWARDGRRPGRAALALVLGNEETGLSPGVRSSCAKLVRIEGAGGIESLNVSQAAAIALYEFSRGAGPTAAANAPPTRPPAVAGRPAPRTMPTRGRPSR